jgi:uncharacterized protein (TIGR03000 family)
VTPGSGQAQHHGGGGHGGGGGFHSGGGHGGGGGFRSGGSGQGGFNHGSFNHGNINHGGNHFAYPHHGYRGYHGYHYPRYYGYYGAWPYYSGYYPYYSGSYIYGGGDSAYADDTPLLGDSVTYDSGYQGLSPAEDRAYAQSATANNATAPTRSDTTVHVTVSVSAAAEIWFEGTKMTSTGSVREYQSPPLTPAQRYTYEIRARWNENGHEVTQTQQVAVTAGSHVTVIFPVQPTKAPTAPSH